MAQLMALALAALRAGPAALARFARSSPLAAGLVGGVIGNVGIPGVDLFPDGGTTPRRRRRRRVLTSNDRADISFITATLGAPAGKAFAMIVAARV